MSRRSQCYFFCRTSGKWGYCGTLLQNVVDTRVSLESYAYVYDNDDNNKDNIFNVVVVVDVVWLFWRIL